MARRSSGSWCEYQNRNNRDRPLQVSCVITGCHLSDPIARPEDNGIPCQESCLHTFSWSPQCLKVAIVQPKSQRESRFASKPNSGKSGGPGSPVAAASHHFRDFLIHDATDQWCARINLPINSSDSSDSEKTTSFSERRAGAEKCRPPVSETTGRPQMAGAEMPVRQGKEKRHDSVPTLCPPGWEWLLRLQLRDSLDTDKARWRVREAGPRRDR